MARIFISHSTHNQSEAIAVRDWLAHEGWDDIFLDLDPERGIKAGERWQDALQRNARQCELVLFLISKEWVASKWCFAELMLAKNLNKRILGVLIQPTPFDTIPREITAEWQIADLTPKGTKDIFEIATTAESQPTTVSFSKDGLSRLKIGLTDAGLDPTHFPWPPENEPNRPPYRGLRPLDVKDAGIFFGRDASIIEITDMLRGLRDTVAPRLLVILGASGAGKSSFLRAGLLARLRKDTRHFLTLPVIRPDRAAVTGDTGLIACLEAFCAEQGPQLSRAHIRAAVDAGAGAICDMLSPLTQSNPDQRAPTLILPIDQGEELFHAEGAEEGRALLELLQEMCQHKDPDILPVITIRSDSYEALQSARALEGIPQVTWSLPPMPRGNFSEIIQGPARRFTRDDKKLQVESALMEGLLGDIEDGGAKDALPLLAYTLERLYLEHGGAGQLSLQNYDAMGRIRGSIEAAVERALDAADKDPTIPRDRAARLALIRRGLIPWLAGIDPETGAPRRRVARKSDIPPEALPLINLLVNERLLSTDVEAESGAVTIEPAHEALLRQWGLLEGWLDEDFEDLSAAEGVRRAARDWAANAQDPEWLAHAGGRLDLAQTVALREDFAQLFSTADRTYLAAARKAEDDKAAAKARDAKRLLNRTLAGLAAAIALAVTAGFFALKANKSAEDAKQQAETARIAQDRAEQNFGIAQTALDALIFDIAQGLKNVQGMRLDSLQRILGQAETTLEKLLDANPDSLALKRSKAAMHIEFSNVFARAGEPDAALEQALLAQAELRALLNGAPNDPRSQRDVSVSLNKIGDLQARAGQVVDALASYQEGLDIFRTLA
ncbi:MAG: TIR domain-containing protein, partial [Pseudomonadota bacterium]